jgi:hypothetical protein
MLHFDCDAMLHLLALGASTLPARQLQAPTRTAATHTVHLSQQQAHLQSTRREFLRVFKIFVRDGRPFR